MRRSLSLVAVLVVLAAACRDAAPPTVPEVVAVGRAALPVDPQDAAWRDAPVHVAPLLLQDMVEPRLLAASTGEVRAQAISDGRHIAFRLEWADDTADDVQQPARFSDACAVQLPTSLGPDVPAPQMGEAGKPVEISFWRASWQAMVDGRPDTLQAIHPRANIDHYPFEAPALEPGSPEQREMAVRYAPARALGNDMAGPRERPVEDLVAAGPGTLSPAPEPLSQGRGRRTPSGWTVVISRPLPVGLQSGARTQVAFAVWEGAHQESGSRKMRTGWVPLLLEAAE
jgi:DMSO reductase family type II enzyme heme b subunit